MNESIAAPPAADMPPPAPRAPEPFAKRMLRWVDVALILIIFLLLEMAIAPAAARSIYNFANTIGPGMDMYPLPALIHISIQEGLILLVIFCFVALRGLSLADLGIRTTSFYWMLAGLAAISIALPVRLVAGFTAHFLAGGTLETIAGAADESAFPFIASPALAGLPALIMAGVVAPIVEELMFRAILYVKLRQRIGVVWATVISSALFGLIHPSIATGVSAVIMGLILAWLYEKSRSLWVPLILHILNNSVVFGILVFALGMQELVNLLSY